MSEEKKKIGFASMTPEQRSEIAKKGGHAAQATGKAHQFKPGRQARKAGRAGGVASAAAKKALKEKQAHEEASDQNQTSA